jgi:hypothetical protein
MAWMIDFDRAVQAGLGVRIRLEPESIHVRDGFDKLVVLGLRLSSSPEENQALVEELFKNHHYAPDGMSLLPQGTPTNNTNGKKAGYSSTGLTAEESFALMTGDPLFGIDGDPLTKYDAQRLAEALGINHELFLHVPSADQKDVAEAMAMNRALWHGTLGYYLEELLQLELPMVRRARDFFLQHVTGRGPLPAIRVGTQPYGILLTSDFSRWQRFLQAEDPDDVPFLNKLYEALRRADATWRWKSAEVPHVGASGDPYQNLLSMVGLHATSVEYYRRHAVGQEYIWNYDIIQGATARARHRLEVMARQARWLLRDLKHSGEEPSRLFDLAFFTQHDLITDPLVDDIPTDQKEKLSETKDLDAKYTAPGIDGKTNYIGWLAKAAFEDIKRQRFKDDEGEELPVPRPLLYRMLRGALLQATYDASMRLYEILRVVPAAARREIELPNVRAERTVTRWEFMEADVSQDRFGLSDKSQRMADYLRTEGQHRPEALGLRQVRESLEQLKKLHTASLERLFAEHVDLCTYRLDAWQTGLFHHRLQQQRYPRGAEGAFNKRQQEIYLGAFGWLEEVRPNLTTAAPADLTGIPTSLHDPEADGLPIEQPDNFGFIHGPSLNHAVAAAVLRNAHGTHFDPDNPAKMAVNLSSERVRTALSILEGIRNGQELGALLGYQFERGLHDRYGDRSLNQYIPYIRRKYSLLADKITPDTDGEPIESKEARNVFDGYALLEKTVLTDSPLDYPYGIEGLPEDRDDPHAQAIIAEVNRMADTLDAVADLDLAEGVYQVTQGNYDRAGGIMKSLGEGGHPAEPEIANTPRSGATINQRVILHLETDDLSPNRWPGRPDDPEDDPGERARIEPGLNRWLGDRLPEPEKIGFTVTVNGNPTENMNLATLGLQPIDLIYLINDETADEPSELESRIASDRRRALADDTAEIHIGFMGPLENGIVPLFELQPLLRELRSLVTDSRPLTAIDYTLPGETNTNPEEDPNPQGYDLTDLVDPDDPEKGRLSNAIKRFGQAVNTLKEQIPDPWPEEESNLAEADTESLRAALQALAGFGLPDAFPHSAVGESHAAKASLVAQAINTWEVAHSRIDAAKNLKQEGDRPTDDTGRLVPIAKRIESYRAAARQIYGSAFNLLPRFNLKNATEVQTAVAFRDAPRDASLTRFHQNNPLIVNEWLQGLSPIREKMAMLEMVQLLGEAFTGGGFQLKPLQLPYRDTDHWVAVAYPAGYDLRLISVDTTDDLVDEGFSLVIVALVGADLHIRIFNISGEKVVDKAANELESAETETDLAALKERLTPFPDESTLSQKDKQEIIRNVISIAGHTHPEVAPEDLDNTDVFQPQGEFLSIVQALPGAEFNPSQPQSGLMIDEWTEVIPGKQETTGIAVHYNQPSAEPPQTLLLCVTPEVTGAWTWDKLEGILLDTLERAKSRAVEPDMLGDTPYAHLLPAVLTAVTSYPFATISTDLIYQTFMAAKEWEE